MSLEGENALLTRCPACGSGLIYPRDFASLGGKRREVVVGRRCPECEHRDLVVTGRLPAVMWVARALRERSELQALCDALCRRPARRLRSRRTRPARRIVNGARSPRAISFEADSRLLVREPDRQLDAACARPRVPGRRCRARRGVPARCGSGGQCRATWHGRRSRSASSKATRGWRAAPACSGGCRNLPVIVGASGRRSHRGRRIGRKTASLLRLSSRRRRRWRRNSRPSLRLGRACPRLPRAVADRTAGRSGLRIRPARRIARARGTGRDVDQALHTSALDRWFCSARWRRPRVTALQSPW